MRWHIITLASSQATRLARRKAAWHPQPLLVTGNLPMPALLIITGTTRGLGEALARRATEAGHSVIRLSRSGEPAPSAHALDLANLEAVPGTLRRALAEQPLERFERIVLVNNAAVLGPIGTRCSASEVETHLAVNLGAPILLCRTFIDALADLPMPRRIINLSSGASTTAFGGWSLYCASKAGLDHFGRCLVVEQATARHPVDVLALSPGVVDTGMQAQIRAADPEDFPDVERFHALKASGQLAQPDAVAKVMLAAALSDRVYAGAVLRLHELP